MNTIVITKIAKYSFIGSVTAYLSFASKSNPSIRALFFYLLAGTVTIFLLAALWEARDYLTAKEPTEEGLSTLLSGLSSQQKSKRSYYLSAQTRLELVIALVVIVVFALVGSI
jgi:hypothetical protein